MVTCWVKRPNFPIFILMKRLTFILVILSIGVVHLPGQGTWVPPGADLSYPRTLLDSLEVPSVRALLMDSDIFTIYQKVYSNATGPVPLGNSSDGDRITRAMLAKEIAFTVLMNRVVIDSVIAEMPNNLRDSLIEKSIRLLEEINTHVGFQEGWVFYQEWQHRSKELIGYLTAYDMLRGSGVNSQKLSVAKDSLISFAANLYHRAMATYQVLIFPLKFFEFQFNNHSIMTASALGLAAVVFNDHLSPDPDKWPINWINAGMWNLDNTLWVQTGLYPRVSEPDTLSGYAEGPGYFDYAFQNSFPFMRAMGNFLPDDAYPFTFGNVARQIQNPWFDERYEAIYRWINRIRMPDGSLPAIHDSPIGFGTSITALSGKPEYNVANPSFPPDDPITRTQYIATHVAHGPISDMLFQPLPEAGSLIFRSGWDKEALYWHFIGKHGIILSGAKSHHQGDATSFSLFARGELLAIDPGYPGSSESDAVNKPTDHNLILVNGNGPNPPNGEFVSVTTNTAYIGNPFDLPSLDYGEVSASYHGASQVRKAIFLKGKVALLADYLSSQSSNNYTFQLHGHGLTGCSPSSSEGSFNPDFENFSGVWQRDSVRLLATILSATETGVYEHLTDSMAVGSATYKRYSKMLVSSGPVSTNTFFLTSLVPSAATPPLVTPLALSAEARAIRIADGMERSFILCQVSPDLTEATPSETGFEQSLGGNGLVNLFHGEPSLPTLFMIEGGTKLTYGAQTWLDMDHPITFAMEQTSPGAFSGFTSDSGVVKVHSELPLRVTAGAITTITFDTLTMLNTLTFRAKGHFTLEPANGIEERQRHGGSVKVWPNPSASGYFHLVTTPPFTGMISIVVTDASGKRVIDQEAWAQNGTPIVVNLSGYPSGNYTFVAKDKDHTIRTILIRE